MEIKSSVNRSADKITFALLAVYLILLTWILLFKMGVRFSYMENREFNLIPFREYVLYNSKIDRAETILNILVFIPLGIYVSILTRWNIPGKIFSFFFLSIAIESLQYQLAIGAFDITDVITNTTGGIVGLLIYYVLERSMNNNHKAHRVINILAGTATVFLVLLLIMLKLDLLPVRYQ